MARALSTFKAATRRSRLFCRAVAMIVCSRGSVKNCRHSQVGGDRRRRGGGRVLIGRTGGPLVGDGGCRPGVFRRQGAAGETDEQTEDKHRVPVHINGPPENLRNPHRLWCQRCLLPLEQAEDQDKKEGDKKEVDEGGGQHTTGNARCRWHSWRRRRPRWPGPAAGPRRRRQTRS